MKKAYKIFALVLSVVMIVCALSSCSGKSENSASDVKSTDKTLKIGVIQYMSHPSLDNCYQGIKEALDASGLNFEIDYQIGSSASADSDCASFAKNMVASEVDMIFAIATPAAKAAYSATDDTDIPVIFCAVNDPVAAKLVQTADEPGDECTGTSDVLDLEAQVNMIKAMRPMLRKSVFSTPLPKTIPLQTLQDLRKSATPRVSRLFPPPFRMLPIFPLPPTSLLQRLTASTTSPTITL